MRTTTIRRPQATSPAASLVLPAATAALPRLPVEDAPPLDPARSLALRARVLERLIAEPHRRPDRWAVPGFGQEVDLVRIHLTPVRSRAVLVASFGRESHHVVRPAERRVGLAARSLAASPVEVAYAIRWLELTDGSGRPGWGALLARR
jgi:hypothetical protein